MSTAISDFDAGSLEMPIMADPCVPAHTMLGPERLDIVSAPLAASGLVAISAEVRSVTYYPGSSLAVLYLVESLDAHGRVVHHSIGACAGRRAPKDAVTLSDGTHNMVLWQVPSDPWLPALPTVTSIAGAQAVARALGAPVGDTATTMRAYRATKRAVVELNAGSLHCFVKVVPPKKTARLQQRHELCSGFDLVPRSLGCDDDLGIVVLEAKYGMVLRDAVTSAADVPDGYALLRMLDGLDAVVRPRLDLPSPTSTDTAARDAPAWRTQEFATLIGAFLPSETDRLAALVSDLADFDNQALALPQRAVHGDFYEAQLLVHGGSVSGLVDVDTVGWGRRVDDLATLIGHLSVLAIGSPHRDRILSYGAALLSVFDRAEDPALLRAATASVVLGLATGPVRVVESNWAEHTTARVALATQWAASAAQARSHDEKRLITSS